MNTVIRVVRKDDINNLKKVLDSIELFPSEILDNMIADYFDNPDTQDIWFMATQNEIPVAIAYCGLCYLSINVVNSYFSVHLTSLHSIHLYE